MIKIRKYVENEDTVRVVFHIVKAEKMNFKDDGSSLISLEGVSDRGILRLYVPARDDTECLLQMQGESVELHYGVRVNLEYKAAIRLYYIDF